MKGSFRVRETEAHASAEKFNYRDARTRIHVRAHNRSRKDYFPGDSGGIPRGRNFTLLAVFHGVISAFISRPRSLPTPLSIWKRILGTPLA